MRWISSKMAARPYILADISYNILLSQANIYIGIYVDEIYMKVDYFLE